MVVSTLSTSEVSSIVKSLSAISDPCCESAVFRSIMMIGSSTAPDSQSSVNSRLLLFARNSSACITRTGTWATSFSRREEVNVDSRPDVVDKRSLGSNCSTQNLGSVPFCLRLITTCYLINWYENGVTYHPPFLHCTSVQKPSNTECIILPIKSCLVKQKTSQT